MNYISIMCIQNVLLLLTGLIILYQVKLLNEDIQLPLNHTGKKLHILFETD